MSRLRDAIHRLRFQMLAPPFATLLLFVGTVSYVGYLVSQRFEVLQEGLSVSEEATRALLVLSKLRGDLRERLLLYRHTRNTKYLGEINDLDLERSLQTTRFENVVSKLKVPEDLIRGYVAGAVVTKMLEESLLSTISSDQKRKIDLLFQDYSDLFEINSARLVDVHDLIQAQLASSENEARILLHRLPIHLSLLLLIGSFSGWATTRFYRRRVLGPLAGLHLGLGAVSRGELGHRLQVPPSATEIQEMYGDFNDMTVKLKHTSDALIAASDEALRAANTKSEFLANMSHEIRTPLNVILGLAGLISERDLDRNTKREIGVMRKSGNMLLRIINDILDYSKLESGSITVTEENFDLHEAIDNVAQMIGPLAEAKRLKVAVQASLDVPRHVTGDRQLFEQALINLANNAVKFTQLGSITIQSRALPADRGPLLEISVIDTGIGIPADKIERLFHRFEQVDTSITRTYGGSGLGLAIVQQIVTLLNGTVSLSSREGIGSTFTLVLPFKPVVMENESLPSNLDSEEKDGEKDGDAFNGRPEILLADDSEDNRFVIQHYLQSTGAKIHEVENGREAVTAFRNRDFDIVLMDIQMPQVDGYQATREIRRLEAEMKWAHTPVIALTAFSQKKDVDRSIENGCDAHVTKPIQRSELLQLIRRFVSHPSVS